MSTYTHEIKLTEQTVKKRIITDPFSKGEYVLLQPEGKYFHGTLCSGLTILKSVLCTIQHAENHIPLQFTGWYVFDLASIFGENSNKRFRYYRVQSGLVLHYTHVAPVKDPRIERTHSVLTRLIENVHTYHRKD